MKPVLTGHTCDICWCPLLMGLFYSNLTVDSLYCDLRMGVTKGIKIMFMLRRTNVRSSRYQLRLKFKRQWIGPTVTFHISNKEYKKCNRISTEIQGWQEGHTIWYLTGWWRLDLASFFRSNCTMEWWFWRSAFCRGVRWN